MIAAFVAGFFCGVVGLAAVIVLVAKAALRGLLGGSRKTPL